MVLAIKLLYPFVKINKYVVFHVKQLDRTQINIWPPSTYYKDFVYNVKFGAAICVFMNKIQCEWVVYIHAKFLELSFVFN